MFLLMSKRTENTSSDEDIKQRYIHAYFDHLDLPCMIYTYFSILKLHPVLLFQHNWDKRNHDTFVGGLLV